MKRFRFGMILVLAVASISLLLATSSFAGSANIVSGTNIIDELSSAFEHGCDHDCDWWWEKSVGHNDHMFYTFAVDEDKDGNYANGTYGKWKMNIIDPGKYEVKVFIPSNYAESKHANYKIKFRNESGDSKEKEVEVDQSDYYNAWVSLGTYYFNTGDAYVKLKDDTGESYSKGRKLAYDAVMLVSTDSPQPDPSNGEPNYINGSVNPSKGYSGASFAFWTKWQDPENDYIVDVKVRYRKSGSGSWNEVLLRYIGGDSQPEFDQTLTITGSAGTYEYQFQANDANPADGPRKHTTAWKGGGTFELQDRSNPPGNNSNNLNVPLYGQRDDNWAGNKLGDCSTTIGKKGCAITSIAMVFKYYGVDTDPSDMNSWLKSHNGYSNYCEVNWTVAAGHSDGKVEWNKSYDYQNIPADLNKIRSELDNGYPVIAEVRLSGAKHFVVITGYSGDTFYINDPWYKESTTLSTRYHGDPKKTIYGIRIYHGTGGSQPNPSPQPTDTVKFPATKITTKSSTSKFAGSKNAFAASSSSLRGQCTWYTYGRVMELVDAGYLAKSVGEDFKDAFWGETGRDAKKWPSFLGGNWTCTNVNPLPMEKRRKGLVAVWKGGKYGHVGFVEEVSDDKTKYRLSDFNRKGTQIYDDKWYRFEGTDDKLLGGYPCFYELELAQPAEFRVTPNTKTYFASSGTIYPGQAIAKSVTLPSSMSGSTQFAVSWCC